MRQFHVLEDTKEMISNKPFIAMSAPNENVDLNSIKYPALASYKLDGIRSYTGPTHMMSKSNKLINNKKLQYKLDK